MESTRPRTNAEKHSFRPVQVQKKELLVVTIRIVGPYGLKFNSILPKNYVHYLPHMKVPGTVFSFFVEDGP